MLSRWHLIIISFLVDSTLSVMNAFSSCLLASHTVCTTLDVMYVPCAVQQLCSHQTSSVSSHRHEIHSYILSRVTFDLFTGMLCRHKTNMTAPTPPAGTFTLYAQTQLFLQSGTISCVTNNHRDLLITDQCEELFNSFIHVVSHRLIFISFRRLPVINCPELDPIITDSR